MSQFTFFTNQETEDYCLNVAQAMTVFFGITLDDAIARVNEHWGNAAFTNIDRFLFGETPDYWAKWIFFGEQSWRQWDAELSSSLSRIERKLNHVLDHLGLDYSHVPDRVLMLLRQGKTLEAVTLYRKETGLDLRKVKEVIDRMAVSINDRTVDT